MSKTFVVTHTVLILHQNSVMRGTVLSEEELDGIDVERLLGLGAIAVASGADECGDQPEAAESERIEEIEETEAKDVPLARMNRAQLLGVMADMGISPENEDTVNRVQMIEKIKQAQAEEADAVEEAE